MKKIKKIFAVFVTVYLTLALNSGCETPVSQIVPYSGYWSFTFSYDDGTAFANSAIKIQDTGAFCGQLIIAGSSTVVFIKGDVSGDGKISGGFADECQGNISGSIIGTFTELMGAGYASGTFSYTIQNPNYKGTWQARRN